MGGYSALKTPEGDAAAAREPSTVSVVGPSVKVLAVRLAVALTIAFFIFGNIATWAPLFELNLVDTFMEWWHGYEDMDHSTVSSGHMGMIIDTGVGRNITETGHTEMIRPTFLLLFCILPFLVSVLLVEYLRHINTARRMTAGAIWRVAMLFRRKLVWPLGLGVSRFTIGEWCVGVIYVLGGNILCFWFEWDRRIDSAKESNILTTTKYWNIIGISTAYLCIYNMAFLLLPVTHNSAWMEFFNVSYANGVKFHRWIGFMTVITGEIHMIGYWVKWVRDGTWMVNQLPCINCDFTLDNSGGGYYAWFNFFGFISDLALLLIIPTSIPFVRRFAYEWFYITHWVLFVIAVLFAILHWAQIIWWILPAGLVWFVSRAASNWNAFRPVQVQEFAVVGEPGIDEIVKIVVKRAAPGTSPMSADYDYKVGNFVYINVPHVSKLQWHPLTIASSPKTSTTDVTLLVKPLGDWSIELARYAKQCQEQNEEPVVYMDGFYGASLESYEEYPTLALIGGGIGVTPLLSILEDVAAKVGSGRGWTQRVEFVFTFRELSLLQAVAPLVAKLRVLDPEEKFFATHLFTTTAFSENVQQLELSRASRALDKATTKAASKVNATPFYEPLRSSIALRAVLLFVLFVIACFVVAAVRWGNGAIQGDNHYELWPLERAFELAMFSATIVIVFAFIWYEHWAFTSKQQQQTSDDDAGTNSSTATGVDDDVEGAFFSDIRSAGDLLVRLGVVVGERPDVSGILTNVLNTHKHSPADAQRYIFADTVGLIISGPNGLKDAANAAVVALGAGHFDVHEEEFEL
jgi:ferric-chelate reductase